MRLNTKEQKNILRAELKALRYAIDPKRKAELDSALCDQIISLASFRFADTVLIYYPVKGEIDITPIAIEALERGKRVAYPVCDPECCTMTFKYIASLDQLQRGSYSIPEPPADAPSFEGEESALCIVPALAFDKDGFRLGYGKGYYDRFLKTFRGNSLGAVYSDFLKDSLPRGYYDRAVDIIVSERGSIITDARKGKIQK